MTQVSLPPASKRSAIYFVFNRVVPACTPVNPGSERNVQDGIAIGSASTQAGHALPVDLKHLGRYTLGNRALDIEILGLFLAQAPETIARLAAAADHKSWREAAHSLKGSARGIGAWQLGDLAQRAEKSDQWSDLGKRASMLAAIERVLQDVAAFTRELR